MLKVSVKSWGRIERQKTWETLGGRGSLNALHQRSKNSSTSKSICYKGYWHSANSLSSVKISCESNNEPGLRSEFIGQWVDPHFLINILLENLKQSWLQYTYLTFLHPYELNFYLVKCNLVKLPLRNQAVLSFWLINNLLNIVTSILLKWVTWQF